MAKMLAEATAHSMTQAISPRDVVVAIVGGTMLTLALTRPRLRWVEQLTEDSESDRLWAERALTFFSFAMGGYAWASLYVVLHKQLGWEIDIVLRGAALFMIAYASLVHFEPFVAEWRLGSPRGAIALYTCIAASAVLVGVVIADILLVSSFTLSDARLLSVSAILAGAGWLSYKLLPRLEERLGLVGSKQETP